MRNGTEDYYSESSVMNATNLNLFVLTQTFIVRNLIFGIFGVIGNVLATVFLLVNRRVKLSLRITLIGLTLNDLCLALDGIMFGNAGWSWRSDDYYCWPVMYVALSSIVTSHFMTCLLALHNYVAVFNPLRCNQIITSSRSVLAVLVAWLLGYFTALGSSGIQCPKDLKCLLIAIIPRRGLALACSICLICSSVIIGINITICWKLRNRRKVINMSITHPSGSKFASGPGTQASPVPAGTPYETNKGTNRCKSSSNVTRHSVPSNESSLTAVEAAVSFLISNAALSPLNELCKNKNIAECSNSNNRCCVDGLSSHSHVDERMDEQTEGTSNQRPDVSKMTASVRKNSYETPNVICSARNGFFDSENFTLDKAVYLNYDTNSGAKKIISTQTLYSLPVTEEIYSKDTIPQLSDRSLSTEVACSSNNDSLNKMTLIRDDDKIQTPCVPNYSSMFICHSTLAQLNPKRLTIDCCRAEPREPLLHKQQCRTTGRIACTSNTLVMLTLWSSLLTLPLIIYITYATIWTSDLQKFTTSSFGIFVSSVCCAHSFANPLLYAWRFSAWRNFRCGTRICQCDYSHLGLC